MSLERSQLCLLMLAAVLCAGCEQPTATPVSATSAPLPTVTARTVSSDETPSVPSVPSDTPPATAPDPAVEPVPTAQPQAQPRAGAPARTSPATAPRIHLSTGVALAQTLPDGTSVLCSMDYQWVSGGAQAGVEYFWIVELGNGQRMSGPVNLSKRSGTVHAILRGVKPDQGPFRGAVFAKSSSPGLAPEPISDFIALTN